MIFFKNSYRILEDTDDRTYCVQFKRWYWPVWEELHKQSYQPLYYSENFKSQVFTNCISVLSRHKNKGKNIFIVHKE